MLKRFALLILPIIAIGCGSPSNTNTPVTNNVPEANNAPNGYGVKNPDRIFQLDALEKITLKTPGGDLKLWIMNDEPRRREGMMFLQDKEVKDEEGMIFTFPAEQKGDQYGFWMQHTALPLDIIYIDKNKKVLNVGKGIPFNENVVKPAGPYLYVIEVKQGLAGKYGLSAGQKVDIPSELKGQP